MDVKPLLDLASAKVASMIKGKKVEEIRAIFNIKNDFTPEEEAQVKEVCGEGAGGREGRRCACVRAAGTCERMCAAGT